MIKMNIEDCKIVVNSLRFEDGEELSNCIVDYDILEGEEGENFNSILEEQITTLLEEAIMDFTEKEKNEEVTKDG